MQVLSTFDNGRVEGFLDMRTLTPVEMTEPSMARRIAQRLKHFHTAPVQLKAADPGQAETFPLIQKWYCFRPGAAHDAGTRHSKINYPDAEL